MAVELEPPAPDLARAARRRRWIDVLLVSLLALVSYSLGVNYVRRAVEGGLKPEFYQFEFGPAVMMACGRGYVAPLEHEVPVLDQFLNAERDSIRCEDVPPNVPLRRLTLAQAFWKYLLWTAAGIWAVGGISWSRLVVLSGTLFAATVALAFALARQFAGRIAASAVAAGVMLSPLHWSQVPQIRDYSKAPFMLGLIVILTLVVRAPLRPRRLLLLAAAFGLLLGFGFGFRNDLLIGIPAFVVTVVAFVPGGLVRHLKLKVAALVVAALTLVGSMWPNLGPFAEGGGLQVVALLGFVTHFDQALGVERGVYEFGYAYSDWYMGAIIRDFGRRERHTTGPIPLYRSEYNAAANGVIRELVKTQPADILARAYASIVAVARLPVSSWTDSHWPPLLPAQDPWLRMFEARSRLLQHAQWLWPAAVLAAVVAGSVVDLRLGLFAVFLLLYFTGYPAIQYHERHYFFLDVVPLAALAFLFGHLHRAVRWRPPGGAALGELAAQVRRAGAVAVALVLFLIAPLAGLRAYQASRLRAAFADRLAAPRAAIELTEKQADEGRVIYETGTLPAEQSAQSHVGTVTSEYLVVRVGGNRCDALRVPVTFRYRTPFPKSELSRTLSIALPREPAADVHILTPVFYRYRLDSDVADPSDRFSSYQFRGFELDAGDRTCLTSAERIEDTGRFPLLLSATLAPGWQDTAMYQTLAAIERRRDGGEPLNIFTAPPDLRVSRSLMTARLEPLTIDARADTLQSTPAGGWRMNGVGGIGATGPFAYLLAARARSTAAGALLVVEGRLHAAGLTIGLIRDDRWLLQTPVVGSGRFLAAVQVPTDGISSVVIANNLPPGTLTNHFEIDRAGWIDLVGTP